MSIYVGSTRVTNIKVGSQTVASVYVGNKKVYPADHATVTGLGNQDPSTVSITKDAGFPTTFEEVTINGNVFVKFPTMYRKINNISNGQITSFTISTQQDDSSYKPYPCFVDESGNILPYVLMGKYMSKTAVDGKLVSQQAADSDVASYAVGTARTYATANGTGYQLYDWMMQKLVQDLAVVKLGTVNTNDGTGFDVLLGMYNQKKVCWVDGVARSADDKWLFGTKPTTYVNEPTSSSTGYVETYSAPTVNGNITALGYNSNIEFANYPSATTGGSYSTYYCDGYAYVSGNHPICSWVGAILPSCGVWDCNTNNIWTASFGVRLCYRPL